MSLILTERRLRLWAAAEAGALGYGGLTAVMEATGIWGQRIVAGKRELAELRESPPTEAPREQRVRRPGGGRKPLEALDALIDPVTRGDPESPLRWTP